jgi:hypothetical protein
MRSKNISGSTVTDLGTSAPFLPGYTITVLNTGTSADTIQFGDASTGPFNTAAVVAAGQATDVIIAGRYAAIENGAGTMVLLGN